MKQIQAICDLTEKQYRDYMVFHVLGKTREVLMHFIMCFLIFLFSLANFHTNSPLLGWIFLVTSLYLFISRYIRFFISVNRITEQYGLSDTPKYFYALTFQYNDFKIENLKEKATYPYEQIFHVYFMDKKEILYLYMNKQTAFLIPYSGISEEDLGSLKAHLSEKLSSDKITTRS